VNDKHTVTMTSPLTDRRVLVVDDEFLIRWSLTATLTDAGVDVRTAGSASEALEVLRTRAWTPDTVFLDLRLPDNDDLSLFMQIRGQLPDATVIMMTAFGSPELAGRATRLGAQCVIDKPLDMDDVLRAVQRFPPPHSTQE
jgi:DNA-binding NtrC family response regulator